MNLIQNYQDLNVLERILFWGKTIVIILVMVAIIIFIIKKIKHTKNNRNNTIAELTPITEEIEDTDSPIKEELLYNEELEQENNNSNVIENNENIVQEEVIEKHQDNENNIKVTEYQVEQEAQEVKKENTNKEENKYNTNFEMPSAPYQRNVLREMSLSQTSPIGINKKEDRPIKIEEFVPNFQEHKLPEIEEQITTNYVSEEDVNKKETIEIEIKNSQVEEVTEEEQNNGNDIQRTSYEIEQEENAIISYKELMEKKDSIQTIDEEEAIISIEELLNKANSNKETKEESKLYNITEEEENDSFINELKQFRKDL